MISKFVCDDLDSLPFKSPNFKDSMKVLPSSSQIRHWISDAVKLCRKGVSLIGHRVTNVKSSDSFFAMKKTSVTNDFGNVVTVSFKPLSKDSWYVQTENALTRTADGNGSQRGKIIAGRFLEQKEWESLLDPFDLVLAESGWERHDKIQMSNPRQILRSNLGNV